MNLLAPISTIMTKNPVIVSPDDSLQTAHEIFDTFNIHHIPVVHQGELVGMLAKSDFSLFKRGLNDEIVDLLLVDVRLNNYKVSSLMTRKIAKLDADDRINVALEVFKINMFHAMPVMEANRVVGIITTHDIIKHLAADNSAVNTYDNV